MNPITAAEIKAYVKRQAAKREPDFAFIFGAPRLVIGTASAEGEWAYWECVVKVSDGGYEPRKRKARVKR